MFALQATGGTIFLTQGPLPRLNCSNCLISIDVSGGPPVAIDAQSQINVFVVINGVNLRWAVLNIIHQLQKKTTPQHKHNVETQLIPEWMCCVRANFRLIVGCHHPSAYVASCSLANFHKTLVSGQKIKF